MYLRRIAACICGPIIRDYDILTQLETTVRLRQNSEYAAVSLQCVRDTSFTVLAHLDRLRECRRAIVTFLERRVVFRHVELIGVSVWCVARGQRDLPAVIIPDRDYTPRRHSYHVVFV